MTTDFDEKLAGALSADDEAFLNSLNDEQGMFAQMGATFAGPMKFWTAFAFILSLTFFGLVVFSGFQITEATTPGARTIWLAVFIWSVIAVGMIKIWFWMRMNHLATLRELKKIELMIAKLASR